MKALSQIHTEVPGGIYLCQVSETISCGACCGLYNVKDAFYENLEKILQQAAPDWYLYGLMITESEMVESFFQAVERRLQRPLKEKDFSGNQASVETLRAFLKLKLDWPYRSSTCKGPANYFFKDPKYAPPAIQYESIGEAPSRYDPILRALNTVIDSGDDLRNAEDAIKKRIERLQATISK